MGMARRGREWGTHSEGKVDLRYLGLSGRDSAKVGRGRSSDCDPRFDLWVTGPLLGGGSWGARLVVTGLVRAVLLDPL